MDVLRESMRRLATRLRRNLPSQKPQLWLHPGRAIERRVRLEAGSRLVPRWLDTPRVVPVGGGMRMELVTRSSIDRAIFLYGVWEYTTSLFFKSVLRSGMTFVDVGANVGYFSLLAAKEVGASGRVLAFEPAREMAARLRTNVALNAFHQVSVHDEIVTDHLGTESFYEAETLDNPGRSSILPGEGREQTGRRLSATTLDDVAGRLGGRPIHVVKIDVEGAEDRVFVGSDQLLARDDAPLIVFESEDIARTSAALARHGYEVRAVAYSAERRSLALHEPGAAFDDAFRDYEAPNFVAIKPGRMARGLAPDFASILEASRRVRMS